ncbi:hypothetical protein A8139_14945 [Marinomonas primoryensis]|uniref:Uncharacterized protein n=1 Tax=Marinomonas primoryensis TaxID=178399 RepID=A0A2Z4PU49_9GAMM|nr:hypothetical protein [Marinomonas primoryensis]AWY01128.1 hypothetical protein A8139_14945 [Marinomonas primoryensis]
MISDGKVTRPIGELNKWLLKPASDGQYASEMNSDKLLLNAVSECFEQDLAKWADINIYPEGYDLICAGWLC